MTKEELIEWLDNAIEIETQKPTNEIDMEFVNECEKTINILMGNYHEYTDEDAKKYFAEITKKNAAKEKPFFIRSKKFIAASVAVILIFLGGFTVYASSPVVKDWVHKVLNFDIGQAVEEDGITYIFSGETIDYKNIEDLITNECLGIKYPKTIPYNATIERILYTEADDSLYFAFSDDRIQFSIEFNTDLNEGLTKNSEKIIVNDFVFFLNSKNTIHIAYSVINNNLYTLQCDSKEELLNMINNLK